MNKLENFPEIYWLSLNKSSDRRKRMIGQFKHYELKNHTMIEGIDGREENYLNHSSVVGPYFHQMNSCEIACAMSHVKMVKNWYENSTSDYAIFFEDDINLSTIDFWNFSWNDVMSILPSEWNVIQMCLIRVADIDDVRLHMRTNINWSLGAYLIRRDYARRLIEDYCPGDQYTLFLKGDPNAIPFAENVIYFLGEPHTYTLPLFVENVEFNSVFYPNFIPNTHKDNNVKSSQFVYNWWKENGPNKTIRDLL